MKICHIITALGFGGAEKLLVNFTNVQADEGEHELHIIYFKGEPKLLPLIHNSIKVHHIPLDINCAKNIRVFLKKLKPNIVHTHLGHADLIGLWACRGLPLKLFCTMHNVWFKWNWLDYIIFFFYYLSFKTHAKKCKVISISKSVAEHVNKRLGVNKNNIPLLYNSIPVNNIEADKKTLRSYLDIQADSFCLLFIGRLRIQKSLETLIYAVSEIKEDITNLCVIVIGEGQQREYLQNLSRKLGTDKTIQFRGTTLEPGKYSKACDVFVLPSVFEGFGIVIIENFQASIPVIATNIEGINEVIEDGVNGLLFTPKNHKNLSEKIIKLYNNPELREKLAKAGHESYKNKYDLKNYVPQLELLYKL